MSRSMYDRLRQCRNGQKTVRTAVITSHFVITSEARDLALGCTANGEIPRYARDDRMGDAARTIASMLFSTSSSVVAQELRLKRIAVLPCHTVTPAQHVPSA